MIEWIPVELAGRGRRYGEPFYSSLDECVQDVMLRLLDHNISSPYALYGHSMGATIAFELARRIIDCGHRAPEHLFLSGRRSPLSARPIRKVYDLPDSELVSFLKEMGGVGSDLTDSQRALDIFLPILRADFRMLSRYDFKRNDLPIDIQLSLINGKSDDIYPQEIASWQRLSSKECKYLFYEGGHFFIEKWYREIRRYINNELVGLVTS